MPAPCPPAPQPADQARSRAAVLLLAIPLIFGLLVQVEAGRASLLGYEGPTCTVGEWCGPAGCPGCGLTRSTALTLRGDLGAAASLNWAGLALVLACLGGLAVHLDVLLRAKQRTRRHDRLLAWGSRAFVATVMLAWFSRLLIA